jgi:hypothetical protein
MNSIYYCGNFKEITSLFFFCNYSILLTWYYSFLKNTITQYCSYFTHGIRVGTQGGVTASALARASVFCFFGALLVFRRHLGEALLGPGSRSLCHCSRFAVETYSRRGPLNDAAFLGALFVVAVQFCCPTAGPCLFLSIPILPSFYPHQTAWFWLPFFLKYYICFF